MTDWRSRVRLYGSHDVDLCVPSRDAVTTTRRPLFRLYQPPTGTTTAPTTTPTTTVLTTTPTTTEFTTTPTTTAFTTATSTTTAPTTTISTQYVTPTIPTTDVTSQPPLPGDDSGIRDSEVLCLVLLLVIVVMLGVWCWRRCLWSVHYFLY